MLSTGVLFWHRYNIQRVVGSEFVLYVMIEPFGVVYSRLQSSSESDSILCVILCHQSCKFQKYCTIFFDKGLSTLLLTLEIWKLG